MREPTELEPTAPAPDPLLGRQKTRPLVEAGSQETMWQCRQLAEASGSDGKLHLVGLLYHL